MNLAELDIKNQTDEEIKEFFNLALWEAIENASNSGKFLPVKFAEHEGLTGEAMCFWQREIQDSFDRLVEDAIYDLR